MEKRVWPGNKGIPAILPNTTIELEGNRRMELDGCRGILDYNTELIRVHVAGMIVKVTGTQLFIRCMTADAVSIEGCICTVEFASM